MDNRGRNAGVSVADEVKVVIPVTAHLHLLGPGKCMTPKARSPDGAARATLCAGLKPCRLHEVLLSRANCRICKRVLKTLMKVVVGIKAPKHLYL